jgi:DNA-binding response OmpR family regulator
MPAVSTTSETATVFIAEDNPILLQGLDRALSANGYTVGAAEDGPTLLELLGRAPALPDLLLLDVMMPGMSGFELLHALQADARWAGIPVILITAATDESLPAEAARSGAEVLLKPFRLGELLERIDAHVRQQRESRRDPVIVP